MTTEIANRITITGPTDEIRQWVKDNLIMPNPDFQKKERMGLWVGRTPRDLRMFEWRGDKLILPFGVCREIMPMLLEGEIRCDFRQDEAVDYGDPVPLYDYQQKAVNVMVARRYGVLKSPAGSGKTQCGIAIVKTIGKKVLWLCHTADLLKQSRDRALMYMDESLTGTITEGKVNVGRGITFATIQTMANLDLLQYRDEWDVVITDECHRAAASAATFTRYEKVLNHLAARHKYGLTATPERSDGLIRATFALIGDIAYEVPDEAVADRVMKVTVRKVETQTGLTEECLNPDGTISYTALIGHLTADPDRNRLIADKIIENRGHSCIILSERLAQLETLIGMLPEDMRRESAFINGKMTSKAGKAERERALDAMRSGEKKYLFASYSLCKEGLDVPRLDRLFMASPVKFSSVVIQSVGRIARTFPGKERPVAYDFVDTEIGFCERAFRERRRHYRKLGADLMPTPEKVLEHEQIYFRLNDFARDDDDEQPDGGSADD